MKDTHWILPKDKLPRMMIFVEGKAGSPTKHFSGSAGLVSTARDYLHLEQMLVNKGELFGNRLLKPESVEMMSSDQAGDLFGKSTKGRSGMAFGYTVAITVIRHWRETAEAQVLLAGAVLPEPLLGRIHKRSWLLSSWSSSPRETCPRGLRRRLWRPFRTEGS